MAVVLSVPSRSYPPSTSTFSPNIAAGAAEFTVTFSRASWPAGPVLNISIFYPDGSPAGGGGFSGGPGLDRAGQALSHIGLRAKGGNLPAGQYTVQAVVLQTITTAVTIERV